MSIIVTHISQHGIIHAADSNLTDQNGKNAGTAQKLFRIPHLTSALTVAGNYSVGGTAMDEFIKLVISADNSESINRFVDNLCKVINNTATNDEKREGYFIHIAGYSDTGYITYPEFYHITNYKLDPQFGNYTVPDPILGYSEDFWSNNSSTTLSSIFSGGKGFIYCNGFPSGRQAYFALLQKMAEYRSAV